MNKIFAIVVICLSLNGCSSSMSIEEFAKEYDELLKNKKEKKLICQNKVKDMTGAEAADKYEECLKQKWKNF